MSDPDHHAEMESHYAAGRQIQDLELEIERLREEVATMSGKDHEKIMRLRAALRYYADDGAHGGEIARRALEEKT